MGLISIVIGYSVRDKPVKEFVSNTLNLGFFFHSLASHRSSGFYPIDSCRSLAFPGLTMCFPFLVMKLWFSSMRCFNLIKELHYRSSTKCFIQIY